MVKIVNGNILNAQEDIICHQEIWKDIKDYEGLYQISNFGRVKSLKRLSNEFINVLTGRTNRRLIKEKILTNKKGKYQFVVLRKDGKNKTKLIHRLIAETFIDNPHNYNCINHKNGNKYDNRIENLEWCTTSDNNIHAYRNGLNNRNNITLQYDLKGNFIKEWNSTRQIEKELGYCSSCISACARVEKNKAYNFIWRYKNVDTQERQYFRRK